MGCARETVRLERPCLVCHADAWLLLPVPVANRSMLSDGSVLSEALKKCTCSSCGLVQHVTEPSENAIRNYFGSLYSLGDHEPNIGFEGGRQRRYAEWIVEALGRFRPNTILELGCGNGALLSELAGRLPCEKVIGLESSERAVAWARKCGLPVQQAYIGEDDSMKGLIADLILSVNVLEHTPNPERFLATAKVAMRNGGRVMVVCPNATAVGSELLMFDHLHSFCPSNLVALIRRSGLEPVDHQSSPPELPGFQMVLAATNRREATVRGATLPDNIHVPTLHAARIGYLEHWKNLDARLCQAIDRHQGAAIFGIGEMARLIRAYAPSTWSKVSYLVVDDPSEGEFFSRPVIDYAKLEPGRKEAIILAVSQPAADSISSRLRRAGHVVLRVDDLHSP